MRPGHLLPLTLGCLLLCVLLLWRGHRPMGSIDGVSLLIPKGGLVALAAEHEGTGWEKAGYSDRPGFLHLGIYPPGSFQNGRDWGIARISRSGAPGGFDGIERIFSSPVPVLTGSWNRDGIHLSCGYPQALAWLGILTVGALVLGLRKGAASNQNPADPGDPQEEE